MTEQELLEQGLTEEQTRFVLGAWERREREAAVQAALEGYGFSSGAARDAAAEALRQAELAVEDGRLTGVEAVMDGLRARDPDMFRPQREPVRFTAPMGGEDRPTREQIIKIPDRARRRAAIAENMRLFKGEN